MKKVVILLGIVSCICLQIDRLSAEEGVLTPEQLLARHVQSIGKPQALAAVKSRGLSGKAAVQFVQGATGRLTDGQFICVSEGRNIGMTMKFSDVNYPGEYFAYNGQEATVGHIKPGQKSPIAEFIFRHSGIMKEGLFGGVISVAWPFLKYQEGQYDLSYAQENVNGRPYHVLNCVSRKNLGDVKVKLYFDMDSYRHVRTDYRVSHSEDLTAMKGDIVPGSSSVEQGTPTKGPLDLKPKATIQTSQPKSIYLLRETFDGFAEVGGLVLPQIYNIEYSVEGSGQSFIANWVLRTEHWMNNGKVDQSFFTAQK